MQTGLNKSKLSFTSIVNYDDFLAVVEKESEMFQKALDQNGNAILDNFFNLFMEQNNMYNQDKNRYKDYLSTLDYGNLDKIAGLTATTAKRKSKEVTQSSISQSEINTPLDYSYKISYDKLKEAIPDSKFGALLSKVDKLINNYAITKNSLNELLTESSDQIKDLILLVEKQFREANLDFGTPEFDINRWEKNRKELSRLLHAELKKVFPNLPALEKIQSAAKEQTTQPVASEEITAEPVAFQRFGLKETTNNDIFTYNDKGAGRQYYEQITNNNEDVVFVHNIAISEIKSNFLKSFGGQSNFVKDAPDMTINIPTSFNTAGDNFASVDPEIYKNITDLFERRIDSLKDLLASNVKIAFPETGFGDPAKMPQELFVYLSKRLYQEFGYLNPGSTVYEELREIVGKTQGITDEEILQQLGLEEDPFKC
jgi:hypothetical protein